MLDFNEIETVDPEVYNIIKDEYRRQCDGLEMIASENVPSNAVLQAQASYHTLKYAEGYPKARYYAGCENIDKTEQLAIDRACKLFKCKYANVQPHSGASANLAVQFALCQGENKTIMGMSLNSGGHLTHGAKPTISGKFFNTVQYDVDPETCLLNYDSIEWLALENKPRILICGASAYPRIIDFARFREIVDKVNLEIYKDIIAEINEFKSVEEVNKEYESRKCYLMADIAHIAGLVAVGLHPSPFPYCDVVTSTTHKTLRGTRGGIILTNDLALSKKIDKGVFPGTQGGGLQHIIAAKAVTFKEALDPDFKIYQQQVLKNAKTLANILKEKGIKLVTDGTDNHIILIDLRDKNITGQELEDRLHSVGITANKNAIPFDTRNKRETSGLRLGTPALTSRNMGESAMRTIGELIALCIDDFEENKEYIKHRVESLCYNYPMTRI